MWHFAFNQNTDIKFPNLDIHKFFFTKFINTLFQIHSIDLKGQKKTLMENFCYWNAYQNSVHSVLANVSPAVSKDILLPDYEGHKLLLRDQNDTWLNSEL